ncbi:FeoA family protein [Plantactinospora sp. WMMB334]|uniref:FeoA family protein n=1 Tax=Plantactinospora sp. WMMB334 TaxID=3404119 RepID=UPI003B93DAF7
MTPLAARLGGRCVVSAEPSRGAAAAPLVSLSDLRTGETARIAGYGADLPASHSRRLYDLGFAPGAEVCVVRRAPALDPRIYRVAGGEISLRDTLARHIRVERS